MAERSRWAFRHLDPTDRICVRQGKRYGDVILKQQKRKRQACRTCKQLDDLVDPCQFLRGGTGGGGFNGGNYNGTRAPGLESHHIPAQGTYPPGSMPAGKMPAIAMDSADHAMTMSHGSSAAAGRYREAQKDAIRRGGIVAAFAMDAADIKLRFGKKYDRALLEASAYVACVSKYPEKYPVGRNRGQRRGRR